MNTNDIREHLLSKAPWVNRDATVDTIKAGDPNKEISSVAVGWMSTLDNLRLAHEKGCDLFITHEPTFWHHSADEVPLRSEAPGIDKQIPIFGDPISANTDLRNDRSFPLGANASREQHTRTQ